MDTLIIFIAKDLFLLAVIIAGIYFLRENRRVQKQMLLLAVLAFPISYLVAKIGSHLYYDPRPFVVTHIAPLIPHAADNGFPSDHALLLATLAAFLTVFNKKAGAVLWVIALLVGAARVLAGVHHPIDIIGSFIIGIAVTYLAWLGIRRVKAFADEVLN